MCSFVHVVEQNSDVSSLSQTRPSDPPGVSQENHPRQLEDPLFAGNLKLLKCRHVCADTLFRRLDGGSRSSRNCWCLFKAVCEKRGQTRSRLCPSKPQPVSHAKCFCTNLCWPIVMCVPTTQSIVEERDNVWSCLSHDTWQCRAPAACAFFCSST